jgi:hypothetical protein
MDVGRRLCSQLQQTQSKLLQSGRVDRCESMSGWYRLGGYWINIGLPMYVAIDRKPEDGLEIQNACCEHSEIMFQIKLVKMAEANALE